MTRRAQRGDGVGVEYAHDVVRAVRLDHDEPDRLRAIADVPILTPDDDQGIVDAFVRVRAELGNPTAPARIGTFPPGSSLQRVDVTGLTGPELNVRRSRLEDAYGVESTMLVDDGPRRWMVTLGWAVDLIRRVELLAERAGFVDVAVEPSPVAVGRAVAPGTTWVRRDASGGEAFRLVLQSGVPVAAITDDTVGRIHPDLDVRDVTVSAGSFDDHLDVGELGARMQRIADGLPAANDRDDSTETALVVLGGRAYPAYPSHDIRSAERQCVAIGAAVGAAGLAGRVRPVDVLLPMAIGSDEMNRPWAIERLTELSDSSTVPSAGTVRRLTSRVRPRRRGR